METKNQNLVMYLNFYVYSIRNITIVLTKLKR